MELPSADANDGNLPFAPRRTSSVRARDPLASQESRELTGGDLLDPEADLQLPSSLQLEDLSTEDFKGK